MSRELLQELAKRPITIGLQTRIDLWDEQSLDLLGQRRIVFRWNAASSRLPMRAATSSIKIAASLPNESVELLDLCAATDSLGAGEPDSDRTR